MSIVPFPGRRILTPARLFDGAVDAFAERLGGAVGVGHCTVTLPGGQALVLGDPAAPGPRADLVVHRWRAIRRLLAGGAVGWGEAYTDGDWDTSDLAGLLELALYNEAAAGRLRRLPVGVRARLRRWRNANTRSGARRNVARHYDLGNAFYALWLDPEMTYSSALFSRDDETLEAAQQRKYALAAALLDLAPGQEVLEIGCGWGAFARQLALRHGVRVTALTLSSAQARYAQAKVGDAGLDGQVDVRLTDWRDIDGQYDRIVAIEMLEAVGERYWPLFFAGLRERLRPGGLAVLQVITIADDRFERYRRRTDFIQRHVFAGGMLPSPGALRRQVDAAGLQVTGALGFGASYARTLACWRSRFAAAEQAVAELGFDRRFRRLWHYYLAYCEAGFRAKTIDVCQLRLRRRG